MPMFLCIGWSCGNECLPAASWGVPVQAPRRPKFGLAEFRVRRTALIPAARTSLSGPNVRNDTFLKYFWEIDMGILLWIVFGLVAGGVARWVMPGPDPWGLIGTILLGVVGAVIGGVLGSALGFGPVTGFDMR